MDGDEVILSLQLTFFSGAQEAVPSINRSVRIGSGLTTFTLAPLGAYDFAMTLAVMSRAALVVVYIHHSRRGLLLEITRKGQSCLPRQKLITS